MKLLFKLLLVFLVFGCSKPATQNESANDTIKLEEHVDLHGTVIQPGVEEVGYSIDTYLVNQRLDTSEFQIIDKTCAILIEATEAQELAIREQLDEEMKQAKAEWETQPHDTSERFEDENYGTDDASFYLWQAQTTLDELKIDTITVREKGFIKLIGNNKKVWVLDIRSAMTPDWTIILFNADKEPRVLEAIDVTREGMSQYFLLKSPSN